MTTTHTGDATNNVIVGDTVPADLVDLMNGNDGDDTLSGLTANDTLNGGNGNDVLDGGVGNDTMAGGAGNDTYYRDSATDVITEAAASGTDTVRSTLTYDITALGNIENITLIGAGDVNATGNSVANTLLGNAGANVLNGGAAGDIMEGGGGNDTYHVDSASDTVTETSGNGLNDLVITSINNFTIAARLAVEDITLAEVAGVLVATGNTAKNILTGNTLANTLSGGDNIDTLFGNGGADILDGGAGNDDMSGGTGDDVYKVDSNFDDVIEFTGEGTDRVDSTASDHTLDAFVENLTLLAGAAVLKGTGNDLANTIIGNAEANELEGLAGDDVLTGNAGADILTGGTGADAMNGGIGGDTYYVDNAGDIISETGDATTDTVSSSVTFSLTMDADLDNLTLTGSSAIDGTGNSTANTIIGGTGKNVLNGGGGADILQGGSNDDTLNGGAADGAADNLQGGSGSDLYIVETGDTVTETNVSGSDTVQTAIALTAGGGYILSDFVEKLVLTAGVAADGTGNASANTLTGNGFANRLYGLAGDDTIIAGAGGDTLDGGLGDDTLTGGTGDDTYYVDEAGESIVELLGEGTDTVYASTNITLGNNVEHLNFSIATAVNGTGNTLNNNLTGTNGNNVLTGLAGTDVLTGLNGDDRLDGGTGDDTMVGGTGNDTYVRDSASDVITELTGSVNGTADTVESSLTYDISALGGIEGVTLTGIGDTNATGHSLANTLIGNTGNNTLLGSGGDDILTGNGGNDVMNGGTGNDVMSGGLGDDSYADDGADTFSEGLNEGTDLLRTTRTGYTLAANFENMEMLTGSVVVTGNGLANDILGNTAANTIDGGAGTDTLRGGDGNDILTGGGQIDIFWGGAGDDTFYVDTALENIGESAAAGTDTVYSSNTAFTLDNNVEILIMEATGTTQVFGNTTDNTLWGNVGADTMRGYAGNDTLQAGRHISQGAATTTGDDSLDGGTGNDAMTGGDGSDTYYVDAAGDTITELLADAGTDLVRTRVNVTALADNVENLTSDYYGAVVLTGNSANNVITGNTYHDTLSGLGGNDTLNGGLGNDILQGGLDVDVMNGGLGNDTYDYDQAGDDVNELLGEGIDLVRASLTYTLGANEDNLTLTGASAINGTGNGLINILTGNAAINTLDGGALADKLFGLSGNDVLTGGTGADYMEGGANDDTYNVDDAGDRAIEALAAGTDTVNSSVTFTIGANIENLVLTGTAANGTGNTSNNDIDGNNVANILLGKEGADHMHGFDGADRLDGGTGADTMEGGDGDDTYIVDDAGDVVDEGGSTGTDTIISNRNTALATGFENLQLTGAANNGIGNSVANVITGNSLADTISGLGGNDTLVGMSGTDILVGGDGDDTLDGGSSSDQLTGGLGKDTMAGGSSSDTFFFTDVLELGVGVTADTISDFFSGSGDKINISAIDGDSVTDGDQGFTFAGTAFTSVAGEVIFAGGKVQMDRDGNGAADLEINMTGVAAMVAGDFIL